MASPTETTQHVTCTVARDKMSATLSIKRETESEWKPTMEEIMEELRRAGVTYGIEKGIIEGIVEFYGEFEDDDDDEVVVAGGKQAVHGVDGRSRCLVTRRNPHATAAKDGSIDFREIDTIVTIRKGQAIYRLTPPTEGEDGFDVLGNTIKARRGEAGRFPGLENTALKSDDPNVLVSTINGSVRFLRDSIEIGACHEVKGDVDYSTGNVRFDGPVRISGDVKSGFEVQAGGSVEIGGSLEDAVVKAEGGVAVKCGFIGSGKGVICSGGDVTLGFVRNQKVQAAGSIFVKKEAVDSQLFAGEKIYVAGKGLGLAGGYAFATDGMELSSLGTDGETKTEIQVGSNPKVKQKVDGIIAEIAELRKKSEVLAKQLDEIERAKKKSMKLFGRMIEKMENVMEQKMNLDMKIQELVDKKHEIDSKSRICNNPRVRVAGDIFPGVVLFFHGTRMPVEGRMAKRIFHLERGVVRTSPW